MYLCVKAQGFRILGFLLWKYQSFCATCPMFLSFCGTPRMVLSLCVCFIHHWLFPLTSNNLCMPDAALLSIPIQGPGMKPGFYSLHLLLGAWQALNKYLRKAQKHPHSLLFTPVAPETPKANVSELRQQHIRIRSRFESFPKTCSFRVLISASIAIFFFLRKELSSIYNRHTIFLAPTPTQILTTNSEFSAMILWDLSWGRCHTNCFRQGRWHASS